jgi:hypothetical protein
MLEACSSFPDCPPLPQSLVIHSVKAHKHGKLYEATETLQSWRYSQGEVFRIPSSAKQVKGEEDSYFYREALAEFGVNRLRRKAFINIYVGNNLGMGFEYDIGVAGMDFMVGNEKLLWKIGKEQDRP